LDNSPFRTIIDLALQRGNRNGYECQMITELEGAILTEIGYRNRQTAFKVRQAFRSSPSSYWQGSAGSVYPAIRRLVERGLVEASASRDARGTQSLRLTADGQAALTAWALDTQASVAIGTDPFRLRAGLWQTLDVAAQVSHAERLIASTRQAITSLEKYRENQDQYEAVQADLAIELQQLRLGWLKKRLEELDQSKK
jgi:DNA-binding PadR family transcriptional regulator